jgi:hypothetical protein
MAVPAKDSCTVIFALSAYEGLAFDQALVASANHEEVQ